MNFIQKLFNKFSNEDLQMTKPENLAVEHPNISKDLFVAEEQPSSPINEELRESKLKIFLNEDYYAKGEKNGFKNHSAQALENGKNQIKSDYRLIIDQIIEDKKLEILRFRNMIIHIEKLSESKAIELQNTVDAIQSSIIILNEQKNLSIENEGWAMPAIHKFIDGFMGGMNDWIESEKLVTSINIFNN